MKETVERMRDELDSRKAKEMDSIQSARRESFEELRQLKETLGKTRDNLELQKMREQERIQKMNATRKRLRGFQEHN